MFSAFLTGFFLGLSLIIAIGAQNAFVLRQGILQKHVLFIALFCAISDSLLISVGIVGISFFLSNFIDEFSNLIYIFSALWLFGYGINRLYNALNPNLKFDVNNSEPISFLSLILTISVLTFANPHVYLDTMILIGSVSQQFIENNKISFGAGACFASFVWFFCLAYGAKLVTPFMQKNLSWRILDSLIAIIMFTIAIKLVLEGITYN
jgi:L-lysine exporter family protein LysE/ArgO